MGIQQKGSNLTTLCYIEQGGRYLMLHRVKKENDINKDKWIGVGGHFEAGESPEECVLREVKEETDADASIIKYVGKSQYTFNTQEDTVVKDVHWYLMMGESYHSKPQREEFFVDSGFYKYHEAVHLLKFANEKQILEKAYSEFLDLKKSNLWGNRKYF